MTGLLKREKFDIVLTHGDTLTSMIGAISCYLNNIPVGHVEAGLRTFSREPYPEQGCTRTSDAVSSLYFAATETNARNLSNEGFPKERIFTVGNSVIDAAIWAEQKGGSEKIKNLIEFCKTGPRAAKVENVEIKFEKPKNEFGGFEIRY